jgi:His-Xaa-Ser system radical SAM maturase HxsB
MAYLPFRYRDFEKGVLITSEGGDFGFFSEDIIPKILENNLSTDEQNSLLDKRVIAPSENDWRVKSLSLQLQRRYQPSKRSINYLILVPTLRCNLACSYCQVSRAPEDAKGFDWDDEDLSNLRSFFEEFVADRVKIEFQGGEISLRPDLISAVNKIAEDQCTEIELVTCTNLYEIKPEFEAFFKKPNFYISTSLDGDEAAMMLNRTGDFAAAERNIQNIRYVIDTYGIGKISFLPTITEATKKYPEKLIDLFASLGASGIFLRPVNYMGFARKKHIEAAAEFSNWSNFYEAALNHIRLVNESQYFEEMYVADLVRKIFSGADGAMVDFRTPSRFLHSYAVIDFDGTIYPSDEARMLTRTRHVDLSVGSLKEGLDEEKIALLNSSALNETNPDCIHCAYMPFCGIDTIDDLSRYNRIDIPKADTWFCNKQMFLFDWIFEKVKSRDTEWLHIFAKWLYRTNSPQNNLDVFLA